MWTLPSTKISLFCFCVSKLIFFIIVCSKEIILKYRLCSKEIDFLNYVSSINISRTRLRSWAFLRSIELILFCVVRTEPWFPAPLGRKDVCYRGSPLSHSLGIIYCNQRQNSERLSLYLKGAVEN